MSALLVGRPKLLRSLESLWFGSPQVLSHDFLAVAKTCRCCKFMLTNNQVWQALLAALAGAR